MPLMYSASGMDSMEFSMHSMGSMPFGSYMSGHTMPAAATHGPTVQPTWQATEKHYSIYSGYSPIDTETVRRILFSPMGQAYLRQIGRTSDEFEDVILGHRRLEEDHSQRFSRRHEASYSFAEEVEVDGVVNEVIIFDGYWSNGECLCKTSEPSGQLSGRPSSQPSAQPSGQPTSQPSAHPSGQPTIQPSSQPSGWPTSQPTGQPSGVPTKQPSTSIPTGQPSTEPTHSPVTSKPTMPDETNPPTGQPTSQPSFNVNDYHASKIYPTFEKYKAWTASNFTDFATFSTFSYRGGVKTGLCSAWAAHRQGLQLPFDYLYFSGIQVKQQYIKWDNNNAQVNKMITHKCEQRADVLAISQALTTGVQYSTFCGTEHVWNVFKCGTEVTLCVDCETTCTVQTTEVGTDKILVPGKRLCPGVAPFFRDKSLIPLVVNPCVNDVFCFGHTDSWATLGWTIGVDILYPVITAPLAITNAKNSIDVDVTVDKRGVIFCGAFRSGTVITSTLQIKAQDFIAVADTTDPDAVWPSTFTATIDDLIADTNYDVYCYSEDYNRHYMPLDLVVATKATTQTDCCKTFAWEAKADSISADRSLPVTFRFALDALPNSAVRVKTVLTSNACVQEENGVAPLADTRPNSFDFSSTSATASGSFVILGTPGCYQLSIQVDTSGGGTTETYDSITVPVIIRSTLINPDPPTLAKVQFDDNPSRIHVTLNSNSDMGAKTITPTVAFPAGYTGFFDCMQLFNVFPGSINAKCLWITPKSVDILLGAADPVTLRLPEIGDTYTLKGNMLLPICVRQDQPCLHNVQGSLILSKPNNPIKPVVALSTAGEIGDCAAITIDPSNSQGDGGNGRAWKTIKWTVTVLEGGIEANGRVDQGKLTLINNYLNSAGLSTKKAITLTNDWLFAPTTYSIQLSLTNFLQETTTGAVKVRKTKVAKQPSVSIIGSRSLKLLRSDSLSIFAMGSIPVCPGAPVQEGLDVLLYTWNLWTVLSGKPTLLYSTTGDNSAYPTYVNRAVDPRKFKLPPYVLQSQKVYTIEVIATIDGQSAKQTADVEITAAGVVASILGGKERSGSIDSLVTFDSDSYDKDFPRASYDPSGLIYQWTCMERLPNFGDACPGAIEGATTWAASIPANRFARPETATYDITLFVKNVVGKSADYFVTITMVSEKMPELAMESTLAKYNPSAKLQLSGTIFAEFEGWAQWTSPSFSNVQLDAMLLTSRKMSFAAGDNIIGMALKPSFLVGGVSYTFMLSATYSKVNTDSIDAFDALTVLMNSPPSVGSVTIEPATGFALQDEFTMQAADFTDDKDDLPLQYLIQIYDDPSVITTIKPYSQITYVTTKLGQGLAVKSFVRTIKACAQDKLGASSCGIGIVAVNEIPAAQLEAAASAMMEQAFANSDPAEAANAVNAATAALNKRDCTLPSPLTDCSTIGRKACEEGSSAQTCGPCLVGLIGVNGDSNNACSDPNVVKKVGETCSADSQCATAYCKDLICDERNKKCKANCSGHGTCHLYTNDKKVTSKCKESSYVCFAECKCTTDSQGVEYSGADCSLSNADFIRARRMRDDLCDGVLRTVAIQDISEDVIEARCETIMGLLGDPTQLSAAGILKCATALVNTVDVGAALVGAPSISDTVAKALAVVVSCPLPQTLLDEIGRATEVFADSVQNNMVANEAPAVFNSDTTAMSSQVNTGDVATAAPQTEAERFNNVPSTEVGIPATAGAAASGTSVVQYKNDPFGEPTDATATGIQTTQYTTDGARRRRRRLAEDFDHESFDEAAAIEDHLKRGKPRWRRLAGSTSEITLTLQNAVPQNYFVIEKRPGNISCTDINKDGKNYNMTVRCLEWDSVNQVLYNASYAFPCDLAAPRNYSYTCPRVANLPSCQMWDGAAFKVDPDCTLVKYSATNTTCRCTKSSARRRLGLASGAQSQMMQFSASASIVAAGFTKTLGVLNSFTEDDDKTGFEKFASVVNQNMAIFITMCTVLGMMFFGIFGAYFKDYNQTKTFRAKERKLQNYRLLENKAKTVEMFFDDAMPVEYNGNLWWKRLEPLVKFHHDWLGVFLPFHPGRGSAMKRFSIGMGKIMNFMFIDTILAGLFFVDDGTCATHSNETDCIWLRSLNQVDSLCAWNFNEAGYKNATSFYGGTVDYAGQDLKEKFHTCEFNELGSDFISSVILCVCITCFVVPLDIMFEIIISNIEGLYFLILKERDDAEREERARAAQHYETTGEGPNLGHGVSQKSVKVNKDGRYDEPDDDNRNDGDMEDFSKEGGRVFATEMASCETLQNTLLRAARITKMRYDMDDLEAVDEAKVLKEHIQNKDLVDKFANIVLRKVKSNAVVGAYSKVVDYLHGFYLTYEDHGNTEAGAAMIHAEMNGHPGLIEHSIVKARVRGERIVEALHELESPAEQDIYLLRKFIVESLSGFERRITMRYFFDEGIDANISKWKAYCYLFFAVAYVAFLALYVFLFGVSLGASATEMWLTGTGISFVMEVFVLQPFRIYIQFILICSISQQKVTVIHSVLKTRARGIMQRAKGLMSTSQALIHHINPACRAARQFPHLPISRLLISLNDFDLPIDHLENLGIMGDPTLEYLVRLAAQFIMFGFILLIIFLLLLPNDLRDGILDCIASVVIGLISAIFYFVAEIDTVMSVSLGIAILILFFTYEYFQHQKFVNQRWSVLVPIAAKEEEGDVDLSKSLLATLKPKIKQMVNKNWKKKLMKKMNNNFGSYFAKFNPSGSPSKPSAAGAGSAKVDLKTKLWPELEHSKLQNAAHAVAVLHGSSNSKRLLRAATRVMVKEKVSKMEETINNQAALSGADLESLHSDFPKVNQDGVVVVSHPHADETPQERLARLNPNSKSSVLSRSALRALKKEEAEVAQSSSILSGASAKIGLENINSFINLGDEFQF